MNAEGATLQITVSGGATLTYQLRDHWWIPVVPCEACGHLLDSYDRSKWVEHAKNHI